MCFESKITNNFFNPYKITYLQDFIFRIKIIRKFTCVKHNKIIGKRKYKNALRLLIYQIYLLFKFFCKCTQFITIFTICLSIIFKSTSDLCEKFLKLFAVKPLNRFRRLFSQVLISVLDHFSDLVLYCCDMVGLAWSLHLDNLWTGKHYPSLGLVYKLSWQLLIS